MSNKVEMSVRLRKIPKGADGQSSFKSIVFRRGASVIAPTGGSFASPVPSGWSDGIPAESGGQPCWMSSRTFTSDGQPPQSASWSTPQKVADTADFDVCFSSQEAQPSAPTSHGAQDDGVWHETGAPDDIWMATSRCSNGTWSDWTISRIRGEKGDPGESPTLYSLVPSEQYISKAADGTLSADTLYVTAYKTVGGSTTEVASPVITYDYAQGTGGGGGVYDPTSGVAVRAGTRWIRFSLKSSASASADTLASCSVFVIADGQDGVGAYALDLDNENVNIGLTSGGDGNLYPASGYNTGESNIYVVGGASVTPALTQVKAYVNGSEIAAATSAEDAVYSDAASGISEIRLNLSRISVKLSTTYPRARGSRVEIRLEGAISVSDSAGERTVTAYKVLTVTFQPPGADGVSPIVFELLPSCQSVVIAEDGTRTPAQISCQVLKHYGAATEIATEQDMEDYDLAILLSKNGGSAASQSSSSTAALTSAKWILNCDNRPIDYEEIAFVSDGATGPKGEDAWSVQCEPSALLVGIDEVETATAQLTVSLGGAKVNYGGSGYPRWRVLGTINGMPSGGVIDDWIIWSYTQSSQAFDLSLMCAPNHADHSSTLEIIVTLYRSAAESETRTVRLPVRTARKGDPGPAGLVYRKTEWAEGVEYRNDTELLASGADASQSQNGDGVWYLDIVTRTGENGKPIGVWKCKVTHPSTAANMPSTGGSTTEWEKFSNWNEQPVYTSLILADNAVIGFIQGQQLKIYDSGNALKAGISAASGNYPMFYANPSNEDTTTARWQQYENGNAQFGNPSGAKIYLNAAPRDGLPRMEVYDEQGALSATFDGSQVTDENDLYGTGATSEYFKTTSLRAIKVTGSSISPSATASTSIMFTCASAATITIPGNTMKVWGKSGTPSESPVALQSANAYIKVDGVTKASCSLIFYTPEQEVTENDAVQTAFGKIEVGVSAGTHTITFGVEYAGYKKGSASAELVNNYPCSYSEPRMMCRYFANGLAIGSATNNYAMIWNNGGAMNFIVENPGCGLKVTNDGVYIKRDDNTDWVKL